MGIMSTMVIMTEVYSGTSVTLKKTQINKSRMSVAITQLTSNYCLAFLGLYSCTSGSTAHKHK